MIRDHLARTGTKHQQNRSDLSPAKNPEQVTMSAILFPSCQQPSNTEPSQNNPHLRAKLAHMLKG